MMPTTSRLLISFAFTLLPGLAFSQSFNFLEDDNVHFYQRSIQQEFTLNSEDITIEQSYNPLLNSDDGDYYNNLSTKDFNRPGARTVTLAGAAYPVKYIGGLNWMGKNLNHKVDDSWCFDDDPKNCQKYGRLYTWEAAKEACASVGWRLPTDQEWRDLVEYFAGADAVAELDEYGSKVAYEAMIVGGSSGFSAQLGGYRWANGWFRGLGESGVYWSATEYDDRDAWYYGFSGDYGEMDRDYRGAWKSYGHSCRCVKDAQ